MIEVRYIYDVDNQPVNEYTISNGKYLLSVINIGASITKMIVPNKIDKLENIVLRYFDYKAYKTNPYYLGCLVDTNELINHKLHALNYYFKCSFEQNTLVFTYQDKTKYIIVKYRLVENKFSIEYDTNMEISLSHVLFLNFSGNVKDNILNHELEIASQKIDLMEDLEFFKHYLCDKKEPLITLKLRESGIALNIHSLNHDIYLSFGKYFNKEFVINKKNIAQLYSGIGIVVLGSQCVTYEFLV